jgi:NTP pyrophosphatase (non-canonical NTP hydrolase)
MMGVQQQVAEWFHGEGGSVTALNSAKRAEVEMKELIEAMESGDMAHAREEAADVCLALMITAQTAGFDLMDAVAWKHSINKMRRWRVDENGCLYHVKGSDPRDAAQVDA